jgi:hypothetical protein
VAITFVGSAVGSATNGGTVSINLSGIGLAENDIVLAFAVATAGTAANPSGYTSIDVNSTNLRSALSRKKQTSTVDTSISFWDTGGSGDCGTAIAMAFRGVDTTTPLDVAVVENFQEPPDPPSITPDSNNCAIVIFGASDTQDASVGTVTNYTHPTNHTIAASDSDGDNTVASAYRILSGGASSAENPGAWSSWASGSAGRGFTIALRPATVTISATATQTIAAFVSAAHTDVIVAATSTPTFANFTAMATADNAEAFVGNLATASPTIGAFTLSAFIASASLAKYDIRGRSSGRSIVCRPL